MCESLPGNRCSSHAKQSLDAAASRAATFLVDSGVDTPDELNSSEAKEYQRLVQKTKEARRNYCSTPAGLRLAKEKLDAAVASGNKTSIKRYSTLVQESEALRARRTKAGKEVKDAKTDIVRRTLANRAQLESEARDEILTKRRGETEQRVKNSLKDGRVKTRRLQAAYHKNLEEMSYYVDSGQDSLADSSKEKAMENY